MERFVFVAAITIAIIFGVGAVFGGPHFNFNWDDDGEGGTSPIVEVAPGTMAEEAFAGSDLRIRGAAAIVTIVPEDRSDFLIAIDNSAGMAPMPLVSTAGNQVLIDGQLRNRVQNCEADGGAELRGYGTLTAEQLPRVTIRAPRDLIVDRAGAGHTEIGATNSLDLDFSGCGTAALGDVTGDLDIDFAGSGEIRAGAARSVSADIAGSGELTLTTISNGADLDIAGSGTVTMASLTGDLSADAAGSGNVNVQGGSVGEANIDMAGSGDIEIAAPVRNLVVSMVGSGDVEVTGVVGDLEAEIAGSGNVTAASVTGNVRQEVFGPGDVTIGSRGSAAPAPPVPPTAPAAP
jgi:hypothetical protein